MSNEDRRIRRNYLRAALRANAQRRAELVAQRDRDVHSVDTRALWEVTSGDYELAVELSNSGGGHPSDSNYLTRTD
jgi:hypothetical protein